MPKLKIKTKKIVKYSSLLFHACIDDNVEERDNTILYNQIYGNAIYKNNNIIIIIHQLVLRTRLAEYNTCI